MNTQLSPHFHRREFRCPCCGVDTVDAELLELLEGVRDRFGFPVRITSGYRCETHNRHVGGSAGSYHLVGQAADIQVDRVRSKRVYAFLNQAYPDCYGIIEYPNHVHIDVRDVPHRGLED